MPEPSIRTALADDEEALGRLDRAAWSYLHAVSPQDQPPYEPFFNERFGPRNHLVAELGGRIVGYVRLGFPTPLVSNGHVRQIQGLAVAGEARGGGVGRALLRAVIAEARSQGALRITLRVLGHNTPARKLYEFGGIRGRGDPARGVLSGRAVRGRRAHGAQPLS